MKPAGFNFCIYYNAYNTLLNKYILNTLKGSYHVTLFIDSSNIYNKYGIDDIGYGSNPKQKRIKHIHNL